MSPQRPWSKIVVLPSWWYGIGTLGSRKTPHHLLGCCCEEQVMLQCLVHVEIFVLLKHCLYIVTLAYSCFVIHHLGLQRYRTYLHCNSRWIKYYLLLYYPTILWFECCTLYHRLSCSKPLIDAILWIYILRSSKLALALVFLVHSKRLLCIA